jgi:hypothetical protein
MPGKLICQTPALHGRLGLTCNQLLGMEESSTILFFLLKRPANHHLVLGRRTGKRTNMQTSQRIPRRQIRSGTR